MKKFLFILGAFLILNHSLQAQQTGCASEEESLNIQNTQKSCFLIKENDSTLKKEGDCKTPYAPCSTFKPVVSLMGFDAKILINESQPEWPYQEGYPNWLPQWKNNQTPQSWMKFSCVWFTQVITKQLGMERFKDYLSKFNYGNQDVSGDANEDGTAKGNGLTNSWLSSSLEISPEEQALFLHRLLKNELPVSAHAVDMTKKIMHLPEVVLKNGWALYGKTGSGNQLNDKRQKTDLQHGWFIGWIEKNGRQIIVVKHLVDDKKEDSYASLRAKADFIEHQLPTLIDELDK